MCWRITDTPNAWWSLRLMSQKLPGLFFTSPLKYLHSVPEVGLVRIYMRTNEPQISIKGKLPGLQNLKSAGLQAHGCIGSLPGSCVPAVCGMEGSLGAWWRLLQPMAISSAWRTAQRFPNRMQWVSWTCLVSKMISVAISSLLVVYRW